MNVNLDWFFYVFGMGSCLVPEDAVRLSIADTGYGTLGDLLRAGPHRG